MDGRRRGFLAGASALALLTTIGACSRPGPAGSDEIAALRDGGHVIFFRHAATDWQGTDQHTWPRERQRLLSEEGMEDCRYIGRRFRELGIPVEQVLASPFFRCTDMGDLAFGRHEVEPRLLPPTNPSGPSGRSEWLRMQFGTPRAGRGNLVLIAHVSNMSFVEGVALGEGDAALIRPDTAGGGYRVTGVVAPRAW